MKDPHNWDAWFVGSERAGAFTLYCPTCDFYHDYPFVSASILELRKVAVRHAYLEHS